MNPRQWDAERTAAYRRARALGADLLGLAGIVALIVAVVIIAKAVGA